MSFFSETIRKLHHSFCTAVVVAAGQSTRMGEDKLCLSLGGMPLIAMTLSALNCCAAVDEIIVVTNTEKLDYIAHLRDSCALSKVTKIVLGGATRTESALAGVSEASQKAKIICIHDGARPFVSNEIVEDAVHNAVLYHAAAPALPVKDTVKIASEGIVLETPDREQLFVVQTPQAFHADIIKGALTKAVQSGTTYTDDCAAVEALGVKVRLSRGSEENIKITTPADMDVARAIFERKYGVKA